VTRAMSCAAAQGGLLILFLSTLGGASEFRDAQYGFVLSPPEFARLPDRGNMTRMVVSGPPESGFAPNVNVMVQNLKTTRDDYRKMSEAQFQAAGVTLKSATNRTTSGLPALVLEYEGAPGGRKLRFLALAVIQPERVLLVTYTATAEAFASLEAGFRKSMDTFEVSPTRAAP
jgi:hypothetical protein